jgi:hypothetical protein
MCAFVGFSRIPLLEILIFKGITARRLYKSFGVKGLIFSDQRFMFLPPPPPPNPPPRVFRLNHFVRLDLMILLILCKV